MRPCLGAIGTFLHGELLHNTLQAILSLHASMLCAALRIAEKAAELPATTIQARNARVLQLRPCTPRCTA